MQILGEGSSPISNGYALLDVKRAPNMPQSNLHLAPISGKLSSVTKHSEAEGPIEAIPAPRREDEPAAQSKPREVGGREGAEPTRFGDWELRGRCIDF